MRGLDTQYAMKRGKVLCFHPEGVVAWRAGWIGLLSERDFSFEPKVQAVSSLAERLKASCRFAERLFRAPPRNAVVHNGDVYFSRSGELSSLSTKDWKIKNECFFRDGMRAPLALASISGVDGFDDAILFGEYWDNANRDEVHIIGKTSSSSLWENYFSFSAGEIRHIHAIIPDKIRGCVYVMTGDEDRESRIYRFTDNFSAYEIIGGGDQSYRSCMGIPIKGGVAYATDTPLERNSFYAIEKGSRLHIADLRGSCIYSEMIGNDTLVFSTTYEPDSNLHGLQYLISGKAAPGIEIHGVDLCLFNGEDVVRLGSFEKDLLPPGLFGFGCIDVVASQNFVYLNCASLRKYDGRVLAINKDDVL